MAHGRSEYTDCAVDGRPLWQAAKPRGTGPVGQNARPGKPHSGSMPAS